MMDTIQESLNDTPTKKPRGRPAKAKTISTVVDEANITALEKMERTKRGTPKINTAASTKSKQLTASKIAEARKKENDTKYKAELQKYLKERLKQGKSKVKLEETIKKLEDKIKAL
jgi:hypothetical protein